MRQEEPQVAVSQSQANGNDNVEGSPQIQKPLGLADDNSAEPSNEDHQGNTQMALPIVFPAEADMVNLVE